MFSPTLFVSVGGGDNLACLILHCLSVLVVVTVLRVQSYIVCQCWWW